MKPMEIAIELLRRHPEDSALIADLIEQLYQEPSHIKAFHKPEPGRFDGVTISAVAYRILDETNSPLSAMEIAKLARKSNYKADKPIEQLRSHFAAIISKSIKSPESLFRQVGRGQIGLVKWDKPATKEVSPLSADQIKELQQGQKIWVKWANGSNPRPFTVDKQNDNVFARSDEAENQPTNPISRINDVFCTVWAVDPNGVQNAT